MWALLALLAIVTCLFAWKSAVYLFTLRAMAGLRPRRPSPLPGNYPRMAVLVTIDEPSNSEELARSLAALDYPMDRLEMVFVAARESERVAQRVRRAMPGGWPVRVVILPAVSRAQQLGVLLPNLRGDWIVIASGSSRLRGDCLKQIAAEAAHDAQVGVVGPFCNLEKSSWRIACRESAENRRRLMESDGGSSASVHSACYAVRRDLLSELTDDVGCIPSYVALHANASGQRVIYSRQAVVDVVTTAKPLGEYYAGIVRAGEAALRETIRVLYRWPQTPAFSRMLIVTELGRRILAPFAFAFWLVLAAAVIALGSPTPAVAAALVLILAEAAGAILLRLTRLPAGIRNSHGAHRYAMVWLESMMLSVVTALRFPFSRPSVESNKSNVSTASPSQFAPQVLESRRTPRAAMKPRLNPLTAGSLSSHSRR